jgi:tetrahydromethanopterin S-methyltransferase subunit C
MSLSTGTSLGPIRGSVPIGLGLGTVVPAIGYLLLGGTVFALAMMVTTIIVWAILLSPLLLLIWGIIYHQRWLAQLRHQKFEANLPAEVERRLNEWDRR